MIFFKAKKSLIIFCFFLATLAYSAEMVKQDLDYTDHIQTFYNPDRGFYVPQVIHFKPNGASANPWSRFLHLWAEIS